MPAYESWTLSAEIKRRISALEMRCCQRLLNEEICSRIQAATGVHHGEEMETQMVWPHIKFLWHGEGNSVGTVKGARGGRQKKRWEDNIKELIGIVFGDSLRAVEDGERWKFRYCCNVICGVPMTANVKELR